MKDYKIWDGYGSKLAILTWRQLVSLFSHGDAAINLAAERYWEYTINIFEIKFVEIELYWQFCVESRLNERISYSFDW